MMQPPKRPAKADVPPREYIFIVDVSGSMHGFPLEISKKLLGKPDREPAAHRPVQRPALLGRDRRSWPRVAAGHAGERRASHPLIERQRGGGGHRAAARPEAGPAPGKKRKTRSRTVVIATDGYVTVEEEAFDLIRNNLGKANMFAFGIGTAVNRHLIEGMARVGMGEPFVITKPDEAPARRSGSAA